MPERASEMYALLIPVVALSIAINLRLGALVESYQRSS
jgi:hypothetical protein